VAEWANWGVDTHLSLHTMPELLKGMVVAIIAYENGGYAYSDAIVDAGLKLALG